MALLTVTTTVTPHRLNEHCRCHNNLNTICIQDCFSTHDTVPICHIALQHTTHCLLSTHAAFLKQQNYERSVSDGNKVYNLFLIKPAHMPEMIYMS